MAGSVGWLASWLFVAFLWSSLTLVLIVVNGAFSWFSSPRRASLGFCPAFFPRYNRSVYVLATKVPHAASAEWSNGSVERSAVANSAVDRFQRHWKPERSIVRPSED